MLGLLFFGLFLAVVCFFGLFVLAAGAGVAAGIWSWWKPPDVSSGAAVTNGMLQAAFDRDGERAEAIFARLPNWNVTAQLRQAFLWHSHYHRTLLQASTLVHGVDLSGLILESNRLFHGWANLAGRIAVLGHSVGGKEKYLDALSRERLEVSSDEMADACQRLSGMLGQVRQMLAAGSYGVDLRWQFAQLKAWNHTLAGGVQ